MSKAENVDENEFSEETNEFDIYLVNNCTNSNDNDENDVSPEGVQDFLSNRFNNTFGNNSASCVDNEITEGNH